MAAAGAMKRMKITTAVMSAILARTGIFGVILKGIGITVTQT